MPLGTEVGLGTGHTALDGDYLRTERCTAAPPPLFGRSIVAKRSPISAIAEMGDRLATIDRPKSGGGAAVHLSVRR